MGFFNFFKKNQAPMPAEENKMLLAMPMFTNGNRYELAKIISHLENYWNLNVVNDDGDDDTAILSIDGERVAIAYMPASIPYEDLENTAKYAYNWKHATDELKHVDGHVIVSIISGKKTNLDRHFLLSKVLCSLLQTSESIGIYQGSQSLLIPKEQYLDYLNDIKNNEIPVPLWIYIGLRPSDSGNSVYTFGLESFNKLELEIVNSKLELEEIFSFIMNISDYVIRNNVSFKDKETVGFSADHKIEISISKGEFVDGLSCKLKL